MATEKFPLYRYNVKGEIAVCDNALQFEQAKVKGFTLNAAPRGTGPVALYNTVGDCVLAKTAEDKERFIQQGFGEDYVAPKAPAPEPGMTIPTPSLNAETLRALFGEISDLGARCDMLDGRIEALESQLIEPKKKKKEDAP